MYYGVLHFATRVSPVGRDHEVIVGRERPDLHLSHVPKTASVHRVWTDFLASDETPVQGIAVLDGDTWHVELVTDPNGSTMSFTGPASTPEALADHIRTELLESPFWLSNASLPQDTNPSQGAPGGEGPKTTYCSVDLLTCGSNSAPLTCGHRHRTVGAAERCGRRHQICPVVRKTLDEPPWFRPKTPADSWSYFSKHDDSFFDPHSDR